MQIQYLTASVSFVIHLVERIKGFSYPTAQDVGTHQSRELCRMS